MVTILDYAILLFPLIFILIGLIFLEKCGGSSVCRAGCWGMGLLFVAHILSRASTWAWSNEWDLVHEYCAPVVEILGLLFVMLAVRPARVPRRTEAAQ